ncbi:hypothetical protein C4Q27_13340 [Pseudomonas sp. SWI36]|nr:hypothetical protein C4Q27_13340 [Pseudomonas sp. SWI36]
MAGHSPPVGAGLPAKGPALLANFHPPFTFAAATVFAGKPAPTQIGGGHTSVVVHRPPVGAGSPAKGPALLANLHPPLTVAAAREHRQSRCHPPRWFLRGHALRCCVLPKKNRPSQGGYFRLHSCRHQHIEKPYQPLNPPSRTSSPTPHAPAAHRGVRTW